ncbi:hypothetical protein K1719_039167 [Acacia pycnantha]|nr:hypothetical protein K1719_039167 [Acacia pycnantha]
MEHNYDRSWIVVITGTVVIERTLINMSDWLWMPRDRRSANILILLLIFESSYMGEETRTHTQPSYMGEDPHPEAARFYKMLQEAQRPLWEGCEHFDSSEYSSLSATLATLSLKTITI